MRRVWIGLCVLLAAGLSIGSQVGRADESVLTQRPFVDYAPTKPTGPAQISDAIPRVLVRFDDTRDGQYDHGQIAAFLRRGLPVAVNVNFDLIGGAGKMTVQELLDLQSFARRNGTELHFIQHSNGDLTGVGTLTHDEIVAELDPTDIIKTFGYRPRMFVLPGDANKQAWANRNRHYLQTVCDSLGLWYITATVYRDSSEIANFNPSTPEFDTFASAESNFQLDGSVLYHGKPGMGIPRNYIPNGITDLGGSIAVERVSSTATDYQTAAPGPLTAVTKYFDPDYSTVQPPMHDAWTLGSKGVDPATTWYGSTWANYYSTRLANNYGFTIVMHDSVDVTTSSITGVTGGEITGIWSPEHIAWTLAMLQAKGHIKVVGPEEYAEWITGEWAPNTDLIANPSCLIPQFDIGDTLGATSEYVWVRGLSSVGTQSPSQVATLLWLRTLDTEQTGNAAKWDRSDPANPYDLIGTSVKGVAGRDGGIKMLSAAPTLIRIGQGNLPAGRYRFSMAVKATANTVYMEEFHVAQKLKGFKLTASTGSGFSEAYNDTLMRYNWRDAQRSLGIPAGQLNRWGDFVLPLEFPKNPIGVDAIMDPYGQSDERTSSSQWVPYRTTAADSLVTQFLPLTESARWGFVAILSVAGSGQTYTFSNPRLVYLGK